MTAAGESRAAHQVFLGSRPESLDEVAGRLVHELARRSIRLVDPASEPGALELFAERLDALAGCELIVILLADRLGPSGPDGRSMVEVEHGEARRLGIDPLVIRLAGDEQVEPAVFRLLERIDDSRVIGPFVGTQLDSPTRQLTSSLAAEICLAVLADPCPPGALAGVESPGAARASIQRLLDDVEELGAARRDGHSGPRAAEVVEQFSWAMESLRAGRTDVARKHLTAAVELRPLDWASAFSLAALITAAPSPDWSRAREQIDNALDGSEASASGIAGRRRQATLLLAGRIAARSGERRTAAARLDEAIELPWYSRLAATERLLVAAALDDPPSAFEAARQLARFDLRYLVGILDAVRLAPLRPGIDRALIELLPPLDTRIAAELERTEPSFERAMAALTSAFDAHRSFGRDLIVRAHAACTELGRLLSTDELPVRYASVERAVLAIDQIGESLEALERRSATLERLVLGDSGAVDTAARLAERRPALVEELADEQRRSARLHRITGGFVDARAVLGDRLGAHRVAVALRIVAAALTVLAVFTLGGRLRWAALIVVAIVLVTPIGSARAVVAVVDSIARGPAGAARERETALTTQLAAIGEWESSRPLRHRTLDRLDQLRRGIDAAERAVPSNGLTIEARLRRLAITKDRFAAWSSGIVGPAYARLAEARPGDLTRVRPGDRSSVIGGLDAAGSSGAVDRFVRCVGRTAEGTVVISDLAVYAKPEELDRFVDFELWVERGAW